MKGILFKPESIKAIVEGRKTQTRRLGGLKGINEYPDQWELMPGHDADSLIWLFRNTEISEITSVKPRYQQGETVYIKETWAVDKEYDSLKPTELPSGLSLIYPYGGDPEDDIRIPDCYGRIRSPLHLRAEDARYFIKILAVRAERLQGITDADAVAEGIIIEKGRYIVVARSSENGAAYAMPRDAYFVLWDSINKDYPWESNPWVFPYTFRLEGK